MMNRHIFESIARGLGLKFVFLSIKDQEVMDNASQRDTNVVYLFDVGKPLRMKRDHIKKPAFDALLYWNQASIEITWSTTNKAKIRALLLQDRGKCVVCDGDAHSAINCPLCGATSCVVCLFKMGLTKANREQISTGDFVLKVKCPNCRELCLHDARTNIFMAVEHLTEFSPEQRNTLLSLKAVNPYWDEQYARYEEEAAEFEVIRRTRFGEGCTIEIVGLKGKKEWNGKTAQIIGKRLIQNGTIRWPVQLSDDSEEKALLKQCNMVMKKVERDDNEDDHCEQQSSPTNCGSSSKKQEIAGFDDENQEEESDSKAESPVNSDEVRCVPNEIDEIQDQDEDQEHQTTSERPVTFDRIQNFLWEIGISVIAFILYYALTHNVIQW